jgi:putative transposase
MSAFNHTVTEREVHDEAHGLLLKYFQFKDYGVKCSASMLVSLVLYGATRLVSLSAACRRLVGAPSDETARQALLATLPSEMRRLVLQANAGLASRLPKALWKRPCMIAIDLFEVAYYGRTNKDSSDVCRRKAKEGTTRAYKYVSAYVVRKGHRFTLAVVPVERGYALPEVLEQLLAEIERLGLKVRFLLLDREFFKADVVRYLQEARRPFLMPVMHRGRAPKDPAKAKSTRRFLTWRKSGWSSHTWSSKGTTVKVPICVSRREYINKQNRRQFQVLVFAYWGIKPSSTTWVRETYRKRFGIETSFRQVHQARLRTTTIDPLRRFLFVALALIIRNLWAWLLLVRLARHGKVQTMSLPFIDMLATICQFVETVLQVVAIWHVPKPALVQS